MYGFQPVGGGNEVHGASDGDNGVGLKGSGRDGNPTCERGFRARIRALQPSCRDGRDESHPRSIREEDSLDNRLRARGKEDLW